MKNIWFYITLTSICILAFVNPNQILTTMLNTSKQSLLLCANLLSIYAVWLGVLQIMQDCGLITKLSKLLSPITKKLFGNIDQTTNEYICANLSANILGMGGAATPMGIQAMQRLGGDSDTATRGMIMLFVINATSLQLVPTTIIGLRSTYGSVNATGIFLPSLIATIATTAIGILLVCICDKIYRKIKKWANTFYPLFLSLLFYMLL